MRIDTNQLEINVNLHALQPNFLNSELHYVIAKDENTFRFAAWNTEPGLNEQKFYCYLTEQVLFIPAGNITLEESYVLKEEPIYPEITNCEDFIEVIEKIKAEGIGKYIRRFTDDAIDDFKKDLEKKYGAAETPCQERARPTPAFDL